jgi:membrane fusion protein, multidrug efflux system
MVRIRIAILVIFVLCGLGFAVAFEDGALLRYVQVWLTHSLTTTSESSPRRASVAPVRVTVAAVRVEDVPIYLSAIGTVQAYNTVNVKTRVDGEITEIKFQEGQDVKIGDVLAIVDPRPYAAQLRQQEAVRLKDKAQLEGAILDQTRYEALVKRNGVSQQQLDQQRALVEQLQAQVENDEAQIEYAKTQLEYTTVRAAISGRTGIRQVDQGNIVRFGDNTTIVVLTQLKPISVIFTLASSLVAKGQMTLGRAKISVVALAADNVTELDRGTIDLVDNQVDQTTGTIKLKASFPNRQLRLWPGNFVNGRLIVDTQLRGLTVPSAAVRHGPRGDFVWVLSDDKTVQLRGVTSGQVANGSTLILRGLNPREQVVTDGHFLLEDGRKVEVIGPGTAPQVGPLMAP